MKYKELLSISQTLAKSGVFALVNLETKVFETGYAMSLSNAVNREMSAIVAGIPNYTFLDSNPDKNDLIIRVNEEIRSHLDGKIVCNQFIEELTGLGYTSISGKYAIKYNIRYQAVTLGDSGSASVKAGMFLVYNGSEWLIGVFDSMRAAKEFGKSWVLETSGFADNPDTVLCIQKMSDSEIGDMPVTLRVIARRIKNY